MTGAEHVLDPYIQQSSEMYELLNEMKLPTTTLHRDGDKTKKRTEHVPKFLHI